MIEKQSSVWIIIVNYRTADLIIDCLHSLSAQISDVGNVQVVVVDNNSGDGSVSLLAAAIEREGWSAWTKLMPLDTNGGFAFGNNASIRVALIEAESFDYIMLLNPDTIALPGAVKALVDFMDEHPDAGIAGSQLQNAYGQVEYSAHTFHTPLSELDGAARLGLLSRLLKRNHPSPQSQNLSHSCDWVSGASMIIRRQVIDEIGLLDEKFFLYFEEVDFCRRAHINDWQCWYVPESRVIHLEGAATGIHSKAKRRAAYWYDSRRRFFVKHYGVFGLLAADGLWTIGRISYLLRKHLHLATRSQFDNDPKWFMFDLLWSDLRAIIRGQVWRIQNREGQS